MFLLTKQQKKEIEELAQKYGLNFLTLFGSQAEEKTHKKSDIDLAYSVKKNLNYKKEYEFINELRQILKSKKEIELLNLKEASPLLAKNIAFNGKILAEITPHSFANFQMYAFKVFVEAKPLFRLRDRYISKNL